MEDPRKTHEIVQDLLEYAQRATNETKFCGYDGDQREGCWGCGQATGSNYFKEIEKHKEDCELLSLIKEAEAFIHVEIELDWEKQNSN